MTDKDRYIIYKMWVLMMRGIFCLLRPPLHSDESGVFFHELQANYSDLIIALGDPQGWDWIRYGSTSTSTTSTSASSEPAP